MFAERVRQAYQCALGRYAASDVSQVDAGVTGVTFRKRGLDATS